MSHLRNVGIRGIDFLASNMNGLLEQTGHVFEILEMIDVSKVDSASVMNNCSNLKSLSFRRCGFLMTSSVHMQRAYSHFMSLETLKLSLNTIGTDFYEYIICYKNLQIFHVRYSSKISDNFVENLVENHVFKLLVKFYAVHCPLTESTANLLIDKCNKLRALGDLKCWEIVGNGIQNLKSRVRSQNLALVFVETHQMQF